MVNSDRDLGSCDAPLGGERVSTSREQVRRAFVKCEQQCVLLADCHKKPRRGCALGSSQGRMGRAVMYGIGCYVPTTNGSADWYVPLLIGMSSRFNRSKDSWMLKRAHNAEHQLDEKRLRSS
jgi:hypothetical protein